LEGVYESGFIDTATGRDLDQLVALVGVTRLTRAAAVGAVVFAHSTPAAADITIEAGRRLSSAQPPAATFETSAPCVLRRGTLSVEAPIRALVNGSDGVAAARTITVINRPIFGIDQAWNPQATRLSGEDETDAALRARAKRALQFAGRATTGAMLGALANVPQVREKDVRVAEDPLASPGVVTVKVAVPLSPDDRNRAVELIEQTRPVGVRVQHNLDVDAGAGATIEAGANADDDTRVDDTALLDASGESLAAAGKLFYPVAVKAVVVPASALLSAADRNTLKTRAIEAIGATVGECGIGEAVIYNRLVQRLMAIEGVLDVTLDLWANVEGAVIPSHRNLIPPATLRPTVLEGEQGLVMVDVGARLVALDVRVKIELKGAGLLGNVATNREDARVQVAGQLRGEVDTLTSLSVADLMRLVADSEFYEVKGMEFTKEYVDAGVRLHTTFTAASPAVPVSSLERLWIRTERQLEDA
ncbi:MAG TPA: baseplate J/gp47 family protein, partial [Gemmatimonadaceae bacterium]|nr:baseplate J/gp47 family protein [Gemmatimonadaceae bacterium]